MQWFTRGRLITFGVVAVVLAVLAALAPEIYTGTFSDTGTFLRVALVGAVLVGWAMAVRRFVPNQPIATVLAVAPAVIATAVFVWPYLRPATEVDEAFPPVAAVSDVTSPPTSPSPTTGVPTTAPETAPSTAPTTTIGTTTIGTTTITAPAVTTATTATTPPTTAAPTTTTVPVTTTTGAPTTTIPPAPVEVRRAGFQGLTGHRGSGDAVLYDLGDGPRLLRFEDVDIGSGPALNVYVVPGADRRGLGDAIFVAPLTAERGNQNYDVPDGVDLDDGTWTVLVWCETFDVEVANATW